MEFQLQILWILKCLILIINNSLSIICDFMNFFRKVIFFEKKSQRKLVRKKNQNTQREQEQQKYNS